MSCLTPHKYEKKRENRSTVKMADASAALAEQNAASSKLQALIRARRDRKTARKKRASLAFYADRKKEKEEAGGAGGAGAGEAAVGGWVEAWDPHYHARYFYNMDTEECVWDAPAGWEGGANAADDAAADAAGAAGGAALGQHGGKEGAGQGREYSYGSRSGLAGGGGNDDSDNGGATDLGHIARTATGPQRHRAAAKIQSVARGRLGRRELGAMKEAERIGHLRRRGLPPNEDFREAGNKLRGEIKQSRYLVAMKEKRIEQLERAAEDAKTEEDLRRQEMASMQRKLDLERDEVKGLEVKLGKERDGASALAGTLAQRDKELARCQREMKEQAEALEQAKKMLSRRDKTIARKDEQIANMSPDTEDVCLSARSFSENMMISLRDDAIEAKEKQLALLNGQNEDLSGNITRVESEVEKMQKDMIEKDAELTRRRKKISHQANQIDRLERALQKKGGEEAAIELTNKQNANLLVLLQQHEAKTEVLEEARTELEEALAGLRQRHEDLMKTSAEFEAQVLTLGSEVEKYKRDLTTGAMEWTGQRAQMTAELEETKRVARVRIDAMQEELRTRREKQYSMLSRLQAADEALRASQDESEQLREVRLGWCGWSYGCCCCC
jgi:hypothetical protein